MSRKSIFRTLAYLTVFLHLLVVVALIGGVFLSVSGYFDNHPILHRLNTALVAAAVISQMLFLGCPIVTLENAFRKQYAPETRYYGSFIVHFLLKLGIKAPVVLITTITWLIVVVTTMTWYSLYAK